jgi:uncharacterized membrane protein
MKPQLKIKLQTTDKFIECISWVALIFLWLIVIVSFKNLPNTIATHFNIAGTADNYGKKQMIFILPALATIIFAGLTILNNLPHLFNYPTTITNTNAYEQYTYATRLIRYLKLIVVVIFACIVFIIINHASGITVLGSWFFALINNTYFYTHCLFYL